MGCFPKHRCNMSGLSVLGVKSCSAAVPAILKLLEEKRKSKRVCVHAHADGSQANLSIRAGVYISVADWNVAAAGTKGSPWPVSKTPSLTHPQSCWRPPKVTPSMGALISPHVCCDHPLLSISVFFQFSCSVSCLYPHQRYI